MSNYTCTLEMRMFAAWVESELIIDPKDYLWCEDEEEVRYAVYEDLLDSCNTGGVQWKDSDCDTVVPETFFEEWKSLKDLK